MGGLDPGPPPLGRAGRRGPGDPDGSRGPDSRVAAPVTFPPRAACKRRRCAGLPSPSRLAFMFNGRGGSSCPPLWFRSFGGLSVEFPRDCVPPPTTDKVCATGSLFENGRNREARYFGKLGELVPSEFPLSKES